MRKAILIGSTIGVIVILALFFKNDKSSQPPFKEPFAKKQIGFYHYFSGTLSGGLDDMLKEVNSSQNEFYIKARPLDHEAFKSMIFTTLDKESPPELFSYWAGARVQHLVNKDKLAHIDDLWEQQGLDNRFQRSIVEAACTYNGKKYLLPIDQHLVVFFYNAQIFAELKLEPPNTWDEFLKVCTRLKQHNITPIALGARERWPAQFWLDYLLLRTQNIQYRNHLMQGRTRYISPEVKTVFQIWSQLLKKGFFNSDANNLDWAEATRLVCRKEAAMTLMGSWAIPLFQEDKQCGVDTRFDFFAFPLMDNNIPKVSLGPIDGIVLSKNAQNLEFGKQALVYFASQKAQKQMSLGSGAFAPSLEVPLGFYSAFKKRLIKEIHTSSAWAFNYDLATPPRIAELGMNSFQELIAFPDQYEKILENLDSEAIAAFEQLKKSDE